MYNTNRFRRKKDYLKYSMPWARIIREPAIVINKDGSIQTTFKYRGPDLDSSIKEQLAIMTQQLNAALMSLDTGWTIYFEAQRTPSTTYGTDVFFPDIITKAMDEERKRFFSSGTHFESNYYCTLCWFPPNDSQGKLKNFVVEGRKQRQISSNDYIQDFAETVDKVFNVFSMLRIPCAYMTQDEMLTYLHSTISTSNRKVKMTGHAMYLDSILYDSPFYGGLEPKLDEMHLRIISPIGFQQSSVFGMFDRLNRLDFSYRWITRYYCLSKQDALDTLEEIRKQWYGKKLPLMSMFRQLVLGREETGDVNMTALMRENEAKDAITAVESDVTSYGYYTSSIVIKASSAEEADERAKQVEYALTNLGFKAIVETTNSIDAWMGTLPGYIGRNPRIPIISCGNLVHMMPVSDIWAGEPRCKHLSGPPLVYTQTTGNTPFRLNIHVGDVGHTFVVGPTGAGKSVALNVLSSSFRKYKDAHVYIFDKGASSMPLTLGVGGNFFDLGNEEAGSLSFQPLAGIDDPKERQWAQEWVIDYLRQENITITPEVKALIWDALGSVASMPDVKLRRMTTLMNYVQSTQLRTALKPLTVDGAYGKIFDSDTDSLKLGSWQSFEMEKLMQTPAVVAPTLMYIFHRIEQNLTGEPTLIILDECWVFFDNEQFAAKIREWLKVLRKANASVVFATQSLADIVESKIFSTVLESCPSQIFLPNDKALEENSREMYYKFGLNKRQVELIASSIKKRQYYYVSPLGCRLYELALEHCPISLAYVAVNKADTRKAADIIEKYGQKDFNRHWLEYKDLQLPDRSQLQTQASYASLRRD